MEHNELHRKLIAERKRMEIDKWEMGVKTHSDPGDKYLIKWVQIHGKEWNKEWKRCLCRTCNKYAQCGFKLLKKCDGYQQLPPNEL